MKQNELIDYLVDLFRGLNSSVESIESYFQTFSVTKPLKNEEDFDFVKKVVDGYSRFKGLLEIVVNKFMESSKTALKVDFYLYIIITYLCLFLLDEMGFDNFKLFIRSAKVLYCFFIIICCFM
jgi:hypothetical protein